MQSASPQACTLYIVCSCLFVALTGCGGSTSTSEDPVPSASPVAPSDQSPPPLDVTTPPPAQEADVPITPTPEPPARRNHAKDRPYTLYPAPNYERTTDAVDTRQLTDGLKLETTLWADVSAVGWKRARPVTITLDLGQTQLIDQASWHTAAGTADVQWPAAIYVFGSLDGQNFQALGELTALDGSGQQLASTQGYRDHTFTGSFPTARARYVRFMADRAGSYVFVDEIEVLGPESAETRQPASRNPPSADTTYPIADTDNAFWLARARRRAALAVDRDAAEILERVRTLGLATQDVTALEDQIRARATLARENVMSGPVMSSRLPLSPAHRMLYEVAAHAERTAGSALLTAWVANPWDPLHPLDQPPLQPAQSLETALMPGERRALAFNVRNSSGRTVQLGIDVTLPGLRSDNVQLYRVNWTGNDDSRWVAAELEPLGDAGSPLQLPLLPGVTQQVWIQLRPDVTAQGRFSGYVSLSAQDEPTIQIPFEVSLFKTRFPERLSTHFGGWDYSDGSGGYAVTATNRAAVTEHLQARYVDTPWARRSIMHWNHIGASGSVTRRPDSAAMERWLQEWPSARRFRVYLSVRDEIAGIAVTDSRFQPAVAAWAQSWAAEIRRLGKSPELFDLLLVDEPQTAAQANATQLWAQAIRVSAAGFRIWTDPIWRNPSATPSSLIDAVDTVSINLGFAEQAGSAYWDWARDLPMRGKTIEIYATAGPSRLMDPYAYYRLAAWRAFSIGATGVTFWSFSDTRGSSSDNEFAARDYNYSPIFIGPDHVRPGKQMEAAIEGLQDVEYLALLQKVGRDHPDEATRSSARDLLQRAVEIVLNEPQDMDDRWIAARDRAAADRVRQEIGHMVDSIVP